MMQKLIFVFSLLFFGYVSSSGVGGRAMFDEMSRDVSPEVRKMFERMHKGMNRDVAPKVRQLIEDNLQVGAPSEEIEAFLEKHFNGGSYDGRFNRRYRAIIRDVAHDPKVDQAVLIYLYVDENKRFLRSEVKDSFR